VRTSYLNIHFLFGSLVFTSAPKWINRETASMLRCADLTVPTPLLPKVCKRRIYVHGHLPRRPAALMLVPVITKSMDVKRGLHLAILLTTALTLHNGRRSNRGGPKGVPRL
jgi:hypothetical protein